jgi:hypothetical protein
MNKILSNRSERGLAVQLPVATCGVFVAISSGLAGVLGVLASSPLSKSIFSVSEFSETDDEALTT